MARVRNNQGHRNKIANVFIRPYIEQENTQEREADLQARETIKPLQDKYRGCVPILPVSHPTWELEPRSN